MSAADWPSKGTFQKFYYKCSLSAAFGTAVVVANVQASKSHVDVETEPSEALFSNGSGHAMGACYS